MCKMADERERVARAMCAEECAAYGDPPCWRVVDDWGPDNTCDDDGPNCFTRADAALRALAEGKV